MPSLDVRLPVKRSDSDGYGMIGNYRELVAQKLKMLILTNPGERVMDPDFGVGVKKFLFEQMSNQTYLIIQSTIMEQAKIYMPGITIDSIVINQDKINENRINMSINFTIKAFGSDETLEFTI
jgi:phage baseplate assembly protein W